MSSQGQTPNPFGAPYVSSDELFFEVAKLRVAGLFFAFW
jgi:hypothetical protein